MIFAASSRMSSVSLVAIPYKNPRRALITIMVYSYYSHLILSSFLPACKKTSVTSFSFPNNQEAKGEVSRRVAYGSKGFNRDVTTEYKKRCYDQTAREAEKRTPTTP